MKKLLIFAFAIIAMCSCTSGSRQQSCQNDSDTVVVTVDSVDSVHVDSTNECTD